MMNKWLWKSYMWTADKDMNIKVIFAVMNTTWAVLKIRPEKRKKNRYRRGHAFKSRAVQAWKFFQVLFSALLRKCLLLWRSASYSHQISCNQFIIMVIGPTGVQFGLWSYKWFTKLDNCEAGVQFVSHN